MRKNLHKANEDQINAARNKFGLLIFSNKNQFLIIVQQQFKSVKELDDFIYCTEKLNILADQQQLRNKLFHYRAVLEREETNSKIGPQKLPYLNKKPKINDSNNTESESDSERSSDTNESEESTSHNLVILKNSNHVKQISRNTMIIR